MALTFTNALEESFELASSQMTGSVLRQNATWGIWAERHLGELEWVPDWIDLEVPLEVSGVQVYAAKIAANAACATSPVGCQSTTP